MRDILEPIDCTTMVEVRAGVDDTDRQIVALMAQRFGYMDAAARIKPDRSAVRDEVRKAQVIDNVRRMAAERGLSAALLAGLYDQLIEGSIAHEFDEYDRFRTISGGGLAQPARG